MGSLELKDVGATHEYHELLSESYATVFWDQLHKPLKFTTGPRKPLTQTHTSHHTQQQPSIQLLPVKINDSCEHSKYEKRLSNDKIWVGSEYLTSINTEE